MWLKGKTIMATEKNYSELKGEATNIIEKWKILLEKCGHLETLEEKLLFANTLETLRNKAAGASGGDYILPDGETVNIVDPTETHRLVISHDGKGNFTVIPQHKDWVNNIS